MKRAWFLVLSFFMIATGYSCRNISAVKSDIKAETSMSKQAGNITFSEVKRSNYNLPLGEYRVITTFSETLDIYSQLADKKFSRSEPIPTLSEDEFFLLLKPTLIKQKYGDIEVIKMEKDNSVLKVYYKEIGNSEYSLSKQNNPILILRVNGEIPTDVKLLLQKN
ncbi:MAG: hypothetical protein K0R77_600 [Chryseobacterium sp.]|jgi:hypothetical protein|uniref:hypothetical protein n=1 Tax=Chryseobacterium sp. TaxID=1871047 RepID=UPI0026328EE5|nr:hypothetical protein [Chryseobacterium sp.]MDF2551325.1 hypothetical protein [Chryseobacterium sp.]